MQPGPPRPMIHVRECGRVCAPSILIVSMQVTPPPVEASASPGTPVFLYPTVYSTGVLIAAETAVASTARTGTREAVLPPNWASGQQPEESIGM